MSLASTAPDAKPIEWLNTAEAAAYAGYSADFMRRAALAGTIKAARRPGGVRPQWRFRRVDLDAYLAGPTP